MAFPTVASVTATTVGSTGTNVTVTMPATVNAGDLLIASIFRDSTATYTWPGSWVELLDTSNGGSGQGTTTAYLIANGTEGGTTVTVTASIGTASRAAQTFRITGWHGTTPPELASATATGNNPDPPNLTPSWGAADTLWIAGFGAEKTSGFSTYPTNYTNDQHSSQLSNTYTLAVCSRNLNASSQDPGTFGTFAGSPRYFAWTIAVRPSAATTQTLTPTKFTNSNSFHTQVVTKRNTLTPTKYTESNSFGTPIVTADLNKTLHPTKYSNTNTFGTPVVVRKLQKVLPTKYTNTNTFGTPKIGKGLHPTKFNNTSSFGAARIRRSKEVYHDYFDTDVLNTNITPTKWTIGAGSADLWQVQTDSTYGRKAVPSADSILTLTEAGTSTDQDLLALITTPTQPSSSGFVSILWGRANPLTATPAAILSMGINYTPGTGNKFGVHTLTSGGAIQSGSLGVLSGTWAPGEHWWLRLNVTGTTIKGKSWKLGTTEPATWDATVVSPTNLPSSGKAGIEGFKNTGINFSGEEFLYFGVGTEGLSAPWPHLLPTKYANVNSFKVPYVHGLIRPTKLTNTNTFGTPTVSGAKAILPTKYADPDTFYHPVISTGGISISPTKYTNVNSFGHARITWPIHPTKYADPDSFGTPTVGAFHLVQPTKYSNTNTFGTPKLNQHIYANVYHNVNSFGDHFIDIGNVLHPHRFVDPDVFHSTTVHSTYTLRPEIYQDPDEFFQFHTASFPAVSKERTPFTKERRRYFTAAAAPIYGSIRGRV